MNPNPPEGWDSVPADVMAAAAAMRTMYVALIAQGFTMIEAATVIGAMLAASNSVSPQPPEGS